MHRNNKIVKCLDFSPLHCTKEEAWNSGHNAVGSMLTFVDLSFNRIAYIDSLARHQFIKVLNLSNNQITKISGLEELRYLQVYISFV